MSATLKEMRGCIGNLVRELNLQERGHDHVVACANYQTGLIKTGDILPTVKRQQSGNPLLHDSDLRTGQCLGWRCQLMWMINQPLRCV